MPFHRQVSWRTAAARPPKRRRKIVLFGGHDGTQFVNDTWEFGSVCRHDCASVGGDDTRQLSPRHLTTKMSYFLVSAGPFGIRGGFLWTAGLWRKTLFRQIKLGLAFPG